MSRHEKKSVAKKVNRKLSRLKSNVKSEKVHWNRSQPKKIIRKKGHLEKSFHFFPKRCNDFLRASSKIKVPGKKYILKVTWKKSYQFKSFIFISFNVDIIIIVKWIVFIVIYLLGNRFTFYFFRSKRTVFIQQ